MDAPYGKADQPSPKKVFLPTFPTYVTQGTTVCNRVEPNLGSDFQENPLEGTKASKGDIQFIVNLGKSGNFGKEAAGRPFWFSWLLRPHPDVSTHPAIPGIA
jgi:hypothetical protein